MPAKRKSTAPARRLATESRAVKHKRAREAEKRHLQRRKQRYIIALINNKGNLSQSARDIGLTAHSAVYKWMAEDPAFEEAVKQVEREQFDFVQGVMMDRISRGSDRLIIYYMMTKGAKFGYGHPFSKRHGSLVPDPDAVRALPMPEPSEVITDREEMDDTALISALSIVHARNPSVFMSGTGKVIEAEEVP